MNYLQRKRLTLISLPQTKRYKRINSGYPCALYDIIPYGLRKVTIEGKSIQEGTPSLESPKDIRSVGDITANDKCKIPIKLGNETYNIYLDEPLYSVNGKYDTVELNLKNKTATLIRNCCVLRNINLYKRSTENGYVRLEYTHRLGYATDNNNKSYCSHLPYRYSTESSTHFYVGQIALRVWLPEDVSITEFCKEAVFVLPRVTPITTDISSMQEWQSLPQQGGTITITADTDIEPNNITAEYMSKTKQEEM